MVLVKCSLYSEGVQTVIFPCVCQGARQLCGRAFAHSP